MWEGVISVGNVLGVGERSLYVMSLCEGDGRDGRSVKGVTETRESLK